MSELTTALVFWPAAALMLVLSVGLFIFFKRRRWPIRRGRE